MLGVAKMMELLQCYDDYGDRDLLAIGQRYGYFVAGPNPSGFNFISGGGGIILNRHMAWKLNQVPILPNTFFSNFTHICKIFTKRV
jgi:hypothetical protein